MADPLCFPARLARLDYARVVFQLEFTQPCELPPLALLQLRREMLAALKDLAQQQHKAAVAALQQLLLPPLSTDPLVQRQVQKPAPPLILSPDVSRAGSFMSRERLLLPVLFVGDGILHLDAFVLLLQVLGNRGLYHGRGTFSLVTIFSEGAAGEPVQLWSSTAPGDKMLAPPVTPLGWWLDNLPALQAPVRLKVVSPMRLITGGKPLFRPTFAELFPFIVRRVNSLLMSYGEEDQGLDCRLLHQRAADVETVENTLHWRDWRRLKKEHGGQDLGGVTGHLLLRGSALVDLLWLLQIGTLLNVGKGAPYGAGQYCLSAGHRPA
ncbi:MAG: CRISPR system precrRNA processing endoribonuclease RAMP protein Cas6 [Pelovirga sp.]